MGTHKASLLRPAALYDGFVAGAPAVDNATVEIAAQTLRVKAGGLTASHLNATANLVITQIKNADKVSHGIPLGQMRGTTGLVTTATPADAVWAESIASNVQSLVSNTADSTTKTAAGTFQFQLPHDYVPAGDVVLRISLKLKSVTGSGVANNGSDIDVSAYEQSKSAGTVGSDLCSTNAQTFAALDTVYQKDFVIDATGLVALDLVNFLVTGRAIENDAGNGTLQVQVFAIEVLCDKYAATS